MFRAWKAPAAGVTMRSAMSSGSEAMVVSPSEVTKAGRLEDAKRFIGRVVEIEITDDLFSCYVLCGMNRKDMIHVEAWKEQSRPARGLLKEGSLVSLRKVMLSTRKADKNKFSLSGCRMFVRFDKDASIEEAENAADRTVPGYEEVKIQDLPRQVPRTTLQAAGCLKEGAVAVRVEVLEVTRLKGKDEVNDKSMVKAHVADRNAAGKGYSAEIVAWGDDFGSRLHTVEIGKVYDIWPLCIFPRNDKQSFALRWSKNTKIEAIKDMAPCDFAVRGELVELSQRKDGSGGRPDYKNLSATLVGASTLTHFLPERSSVKFDSEEVWELPFVIVTDVNLTTYGGCSSCLKKSCGHSAPKRVCYNVELMVADHTATLEGKVWTWVMDDVLKVAGIEKPEGGIANEEQVRKVLCGSQNSSNEQQHAKQLCFIALHYLQFQGMAKRGVKEEKQEDLGFVDKLLGECGFKCPNNKHYHANPNRRLQMLQLPRFFPKFMNDTKKNENPEVEWVGHFSWKETILSSG